MLSIRFDEEREWWISGQSFDRLFRFALEHGILRAELEEWQHVANANGGLDLTQLEEAEAEELATGLRAAAERELAELQAADPESPDGSYKTGLERLLSVIPRAAA